MVVMNAQDFSQLLQEFSPQSEDQRKSFEQLTYRYPYFHTAYAHYLKTLKAQEQYNYNLILRKTAILSPSRAYLHQWLERDEKKETETKKEAETVEVPSPVEKTPLPPTAESIPEEKKELPLAEETPKTEVKPISSTENKKPTKAKPKKTEKKKSIVEKQHAFDEWVALANRNKVPEQNPAVEWEEKLSLIDAFLEKNPKMPAVSPDQPKVDLSKGMTFDKEELMTETLAKVYVKQKKYNKALLAYKILSLKYPEKNSFFADQIKEIKKLKQNT